MRMGRKITSAVLFFLAGGVFLTPSLSAQDPEKSACHLFLDFDFAITLEVVADGSQVTPILNLIAFSGGSWEISASDLKILNDKGRYAVDPRFSIDTGDSAQPYVTTYLRIEGGDFLGCDLVGDFKDYKEPKLVRIKIGNEWFSLAPVDPDAFEKVLDSLDRLDLKDPDLVSAFEKLDLPFLGSRDSVDE